MADGEQKGNAALINWGWLAAIAAIAFGCAACLVAPLVPFLIDLLWISCIAQPNVNVLEIDPNQVQEIVVRYAPGSITDNSGPSDINVQHALAVMLIDKTVTFR